MISISTFSPRLASKVDRSCDNSAHVTIADINEELGKSPHGRSAGKGITASTIEYSVCLITSLPSGNELDASPPLVTNVTMRSVRFNATRNLLICTSVQFINTTNWESQAAAFKAAIAFSPSKTTIGVVFAAAGIFGQPFLTADENLVTLDSAFPEPSTIAIQVNTIGCYYTTKLARLYFKLPSSTPSSEPKSLIIVGSLASYFNILVMGSYNASKHGVRGLFLNVRTLFSDRGIRVNMLSP